MLDNVALDVVIGLVFVYLLYSLYATVIMEMISSFLGLRGRNLDYALKRMLMDENKKDNWFLDLLSRYGESIVQMTGKSMSMKTTDLYTDFFNQRTIKYLNNGGVNNMPSYLPKESFTKGIIDAIKSNDPDLNKLNNLIQGLEQLPESEAKKHIESLLTDANYDLNKFRILLEDWFNHTMDRSVGWYKRSVQLLLFITGMTLAIIFNVDTIATIRKLSNDRDAREQLVRMATDFSEENAPLVEAIRNKKTTNDAGKKSNTAKADTLKIKVDSESANVQKALMKRLDSLAEIKNMLHDDIVQSQNVLSSNWNINSIIRKDDVKRDPKDIHRDSIQVHYKDDENDLYLTVHKSVDKDVLNARKLKSITKATVCINTFWYKVSYVFSRDHFWGYFLTALAISLGSPFWFDLLNKLVKLKTSKPITTSSDSKVYEEETTRKSNRATLDTIG
ncbi:MAG: hypothetical protein ABI663_10750 [Chryseolinea sp.]